MRDTFKNDRIIGSCILYGILLVNADCNGVPTTGWDCCSSTHPCGFGEGDCDTDEECKENLYCGKDICAIEFASNYSAWSKRADCCLPGRFNLIKSDSKITF